MTDATYPIGKRVDFDATIVKATVYDTKKPGTNPYKPWKPRKGVSLIMRTTGGRLVQIRRSFPVDSSSPLLRLSKGDRVTCKNWAIDYVKTFDDGTPLSVMTKAPGFDQPSIEKVRR